MASELVCPEHGPYDASYGTCPFCQAQSGGTRPQAPAPLDEDDLPTELGAGPAGFDEDEAETELGVGLEGRRLMDEGPDDWEPTEIGRGALDDVTEIEFVDSGAKALFWVKEGRKRGRTLPIKDGTVIGRTQGDLILDDPKVSNPHAKITFEDDAFVIWDFGSRNGTYVNGEKIRAATPLKENDEVKIGDLVFVVKILE